MENEALMTADTFKIFFLVTFVIHLQERQAGHD